MSNQQLIRWDCHFQKIPPWITSTGHVTAPHSFGSNGVRSRIEENIFVMRSLLLGLKALASTHSSIKLSLEASELRMSLRGRHVICTHWRPHLHQNISSVEHAKHLMEDDPNHHPPFQSMHCARSDIVPGFRQSEADVVVGIVEDVR